MAILLFRLSTVHQKSVCGRLPAHCAAPCAPTLWTTVRAFTRPPIVLHTVLLYIPGHQDGEEAVSGLRFSLF